MTESAGWDPRAAKGLAVPRGRLGLWPPAAPLLAPSLFLSKNKSCKFPADSEKLAGTTFLKQKRQQKTGTGTGHPVNRLVP